MKINGNKLKLAIKGSGLTQDQAAKKMGMSRQTLSVYLKTEFVNSDFLQKVKTILGIDALQIANETTSRLPRLEANPLHLASDPLDANESKLKFEDQGDGILRFRVPIIPYKAYAGYLRGYQDQEFFEDLKTISVDVHKEYRGHYLAFEVQGDSMITTDPEQFEYMALPGWKAIARELPSHHWRYKLHTHKTDTWIIVHKTEGILIKNIINHQVDLGLITIHSLNPKYSDEVLKLDDVAQIFSVVKYVIDK